MGCAGFGRRGRGIGACGHAETTMPTYEYQCTSCKHTFEQFQSMKDAALKKCPACGKPKLERLIGTGGAIIFKGGGFYQTDYRSDAYKKSAEADKAPSTTAPDAGKSGGDSGASTPKPEPTKASASAGGSENPRAGAKGEAKGSRKKKAE